MSSSQIVPLIAGVGAMGLGAAAYYYNSNTNKGYQKLNPVVDLGQQTVEVSKSERDRVSQIVKDGRLWEYLHEDARTLYESFRRGARESNNGECVGWREGDGQYRWITYDEVVRRAEHLAAGFLAKGLKPGQQTFVGLYAQNRPEWIVAEQACYVYSMIVVPLYDTLGPDSCAFIINQAEMQLVVVDKVKKAEGLLDQRSQCPSLRCLVVMEGIPAALKARADAAGVELIAFDELIALGKAPERKLRPQPPQPQDLATVCYTSGTTGTPKGAMLTHANIIADCSALGIIRHVALTKEDVMISFLPLAHMFERVVEACVYMVGGKVGFFRGDIRVLTEDIKELKPTLVPVVPRLLNRIYDKVTQEVSKSSLKKFLFDWALQSKETELKKSVVRTNSLWDKLVFKRVREGLGGRVRLMITGSAPLSESVLTFIRAATGCIVLEGYGQTECVAACSLTIEGDHTPGHVGPPIPSCRIKLVDVPEMDYFAKNGSGEVCVKGPIVFKGYYKDPEKTREALDDDGWLHTGDIGRWTENGTLKLVDRKKHIFKLAQGEYIAPEKVENVYVRSKFIAQIYVHGDSLKSCLVAVVVPDPETLPKIVRKELGVDGSIEELCRNEKVKKLILDDMTAEGKKSGLHSFEQVKDIYLCQEAFSIENGLLTPTLKSKRPALKEYFKEQIAQMYKALD